MTFLTEAVRRAPGTPSEQFVPVLKAANTTEFDHVRGLDAIGGRPLTRRFWIPDAAFGHGGAGLFASIEAVETIEISLYLVGVTMYTMQRKAERSRLCAEALGHGVGASRAGAVRQRRDPRRGRGAQQRRVRAVLPKSATAAKHALEGLGIGYDAKGAKPGKFYEYPGNPLANGTGLPVTANTPS